MICPICREKGIRAVNPVWYNQKSIEVCRDCRLKLNLKEISIQVNKERTPRWKVHVPAKLE